MYKEVDKKTGTIKTEKAQTTKENQIWVNETDLLDFSKWQYCIVNM